MMLVDTSAWIEWLVSSPIGATLSPELPDRRQWLVPTIVQLELAKWLIREVGEAKADQVIAFTETCVVAPLDTTIALLAADLCAPTNWRRRTRSSTPRHSPTVPIS
ncbi:MAG: PIN domain-containing protein [Rhodospirillaceae bacterium]